MKHEKSLLIICLIICLFSIASVCAGEVNETVVASENQNALITIEDSDEIVSYDNQNDENVSVDSNGVDYVGVTGGIELSASTGTFTDLANEISKGNKELKITKNYIYDSIKDSNYADGIVIDKEITIDGNGFTINGNNQARALKVVCSNVVLKNFSFVNCSASTLSSSSNSYSKGGAIYWQGINGILSNCSFVNCSASISSSYSYSYSNGGAIYWQGINGILSNCSFVNCSASTLSSSSHSYSNGGAIYWQGISGTLSDCSFVNCSASISSSYSFSFSNGGAIYWLAKYAVLNNCCFMNCSSSSYTAGAVYLDSLYGVLSNCSFMNCSSSTSGGAVDWHGSNNVLCNCSFVNCSSSVGGAISIGGHDNVLCNCSFVNCSSSAYGGAVFCSSNNVLSNCSFVNCFSFDLSLSSDRGGGAVYWYGENGTLSDCSFLNCYFLSPSSYSGGGAIYWHGVDGTLRNCSLINCYYSSLSSSLYYVGGGAVYWQGVNGTLSDCSLINCSSTQKGGGIYVRSKNVTLSHSYFVNCVAEDNGGGIYWSGSEGILSDSNFINCTYYEIYWDGDDGQISDCNCSSCNHPIIHNSFVKINVVDNIDFNEILVVNATVISGATGNICIYVNDSFKRNVNVGELCYLDDLQCGVNIVKAVYNGDGYYEGSEDIAKVIVNKINSVISIDNIIFDYGGSNSTLAVVDGVLDINAFVINHSEAIVNIKNNEITVSGLDVGNYTLVAITVPDNNHISVNTTTNIIVNKIDSIITAPDIVFDYGLYGSTNVYLEGANMFNVSVIGHSEAMVGIVGDEIYVSSLNAGEYYLNITSIPDNNHNSATITPKITVNKVNASIYIPAIEFDYGSEATVSPILDGVVSINYAFIANHKEAVIQISEDNKITVSGLNAGSYTLVATTIPDDNHNPISSVSTDVIVNKIDSSIIVPEINFNYGLYGSTKVILNGATKFNANIEGDSTSLSINDDVIVVFGLNAGIYNLTVTTVPDSNHNAVTSVSKIIVNKLGTILSSTDVTKVYGDSKNIVIKLNDVYGNIFVDELVKVKLNNVDYFVKVNSNGQAIMAIPNNLAVKSYSVAISFDGNSNYKESTTTVKVTVKKATPKLTASAKTFKVNVKTKQYTVTLKDHKNKAMGKAKLTIKVNGKTFSATTNSKGQATFKITNLKKKATFKATVTYAGNSCYNKVTKSVKITVK